MGASIDKYRVPLTAKQILAVLPILRAASAIETSISLDEAIYRLASYEFKIHNKAIAPAYTSKAKQSLEESLGMTTPDPSLAIPKETIWLNAYQKYLDSGSIWDTLSVSEIEAAKEHMYLNFLMSPEEVAEFESPKS